MISRPTMSNIVEYCHQITLEPKKKSFLGFGDLDKKKPYLMQLFEIPPLEMCIYALFSPNWESKMHDSTGNDE